MWLRIPTERGLRFTYSRCLLLGLDFNLAAGDLSITCPVFIGSGDLGNAFPVWNATVRIPETYSENQFAVAKQTYFNSVVVACQCRDAGIAFAACGWHVWPSNNLTIGRVGALPFWYRAGLYGATLSYLIFESIFLARRRKVRRQAAEQRSRPGTSSATKLSQRKITTTGRRRLPSTPGLCSNQLFQPAILTPTAHI